jgi:hypothetical protein
MFASRYGGSMCGISVCFAGLLHVSPYGQPLALIYSFIVVGPRGLTQFILSATTVALSFKQTRGRFTRYF